MAELLPALSRRFSCRRFKSRPVADDALGVVLEAGRIAPSAVGIEPWRFIVVQSPAAKEKVAAACHGQSPAATAPVLIAIVALVDALAPGSAFVEARLAAEAGTSPPPEWLREAYRNMYAHIVPESWAVSQCCFAAAQMMAQATALGLGSCPMGGFDEGALAAALELPKGEVPALVLALGHCDEKQGERRRRGRDEVVTVI